MEYNVVGFEFCEQQVQDVLKVIETIKPVVRIIRDSYKIIERLEDIHEEGIEANGKIKAYTEILNMKPNKTLTKRIETKIKKLESIINQGLEEYQNLEEYQVEVKEDLKEYLKYILSFNWLHVQILVEVISRIPEDDDLACLVTVLLFTNESIEEEEREEIFNYLSESSIDIGLKHAIRSTFLGEEDAIINYIATKEFTEE